MGFTARDLDRHSDLIRVGARLKAIGSERCEQRCGLILGVKRGNRPEQGGGKTCNKASQVHGWTALGLILSTRKSAGQGKNFVPAGSATSSWLPLAVRASPSPARIILTNLPVG